MKRLLFIISLVYLFNGSTSFSAETPVYPAKFELFGIEVQEAFQKQGNNIEKLNQTLLKLAKENNYIASFHIGKHLHLGVFQPYDDPHKNNVEGTKYLENAAESGYPEAFGVLGDNFAFSETIGIDAEKGINFYEQGAEKGDSWSALKLGLIYRDGLLGIEPDSKRSLQYLLLASNQINGFFMGTPDALFTLGQYYKKGIGVPRHDTMALMWIILSRHLSESNSSVFGATLQKATELERNYASSMTTDGQNEAVKLANQCLEQGLIDCNNLVPPDETNINQLIKKKLN